jgi:hypothetical protein
MFTGSVLSKLENIQLDSLEVIITSAIFPGLPKAKHSIFFLKLAPAPLNHVSFVVMKEDNKVNTKWRMSENQISVSSIQ